jgi:predicted negative regulator of RcsB-dependent stress response
MSGYDDFRSEGYAALVLATESKDASVTAWAHALLGKRLIGENHLDALQHLMTAFDQLSNIDARMDAAGGLGQYFFEHDEIGKAEQYFLNAIEYGNSETFALASFRYGAILLQLGRADEAISILERATTHSDDAYCARCAFLLGQHFEDGGNLEAARRYYNVGSSSSDPDARTACSYHLAVLLCDSQELELALAALEIAAQYPESEYLPLIKCLQGTILRRQGKYNYCWRPLIEAARSGTAVVACEANIQLSLAAAEVDDQSKAHLYARLALEARPAEYHPMELLGVAAQMDESDPELMRSIYMLALNQEDPELRSAAHIGLGRSLMLLGDSEGARAAFEKGLESPSEEGRHFARLGLRELAGEDPYQGVVGA